LTIELEDYLKPVNTSVETYFNHFCNSLPSVERQKTEEKIKALGPLKLTIQLEDFMKSRPVTSPESENYTLTDMDSGERQPQDPPDWDQWLDNALEDLSKDEDLFSLLENISPDEWAEDFDLEALVLPEDLVHVEDMPSDEGIDLMYDLVS